MNKDVLQRVRARSPIGQVEELRNRVEELEREVRECRRQHLRVAELTDVVQELLLPLAQQDRDAVDDVLQRYSAQLG